MYPTHVIDTWAIELRHYHHGADTPTITFAAHYDNLGDIAADYGTWVSTCDPDLLLADLADEAATSWMDSSGNDHDTDDDGPWNVTVWGPTGQYVLWVQDFDRWHEHQAEKRRTCTIRPRRRTRPARSYRRYRTLVPA